MSSEKDIRDEEKRVIAQLFPADVSALKSDALSPAETEAKAETIAVTKANLKYSKMFVLAILAGAFIAFGGMFFGIVLGDSELSFAPTRILGGACFALGLTLVLCCGAELFTGNTLMITGLMSKKITVSKMLINWIIVWLGNLVGALIVVFLLYCAGFGNMNGGAVGAALVATAVGKVTPSWITLMFKGILCNILVCLAVWIGFSARTIADKVIGLFLPITAFVACGFEHCVANMFFLPMGIVLKSSGFALTDATALNVGSALLNISAATVGNIIGGMICVGLAYWFIYSKRGK